MVHAGPPAFLKLTAPYSEHPVLAELAALERALNDAFDAPDAEVLALADMARFAPEAWPDLTFQAHPVTSRLDLATNAAAIWLALKDDALPGRPHAGPARSPADLASGSDADVS